MRQTWVRASCSIVMDGWTNIGKRPLINIIVTCQDGPFFLKSIVVIDATLVCTLVGLLIQSKYKHTQQCTERHWQNLVGIHLGDNCERCAHIYLQPPYLLSSVQVSLEEGIPQAHKD
jgi:hypothetical protein